MSMAATLTMVLMLSLLAGFFILQNVLLASLSFVEQKVEVVAYVENTATQDQVDTLIATTEAMLEVASVEFITRDEALARFRATQEAQGRTRPQPVPRVQPAVRLDQRQVSRARRSRRGDRGPGKREDPIVRNVLNTDALVQRVLTVTNVVRTAGVAMVGIVGLIVLFIIVNTIRLAVVARAEEIETAPRRRVGRVHPLAVRVRGRARGPARRRHHAGAPVRRVGAAQP